ncbi:c-type mannose receptor 2 [Caerostris darwini]|uniref:C-type mannose receptor 2 n=1 Tax=Caerostris darwini TaxID=1538125 RepID=A0AAV4RX57_9ARAC|nr:c-type mannose receptor 2 [Caerostris darwini]
MAFSAHLLLVVILSFFPSFNGYKQFEYCTGTSWIKFQGNCYLFRSSYGNRVSYYDAEDYCRSQGAHLVSIHSEAENEFLLDTMEQGRFGGRLWIGLNILAGKNNEQWSDGSPVDYMNKVAKEFYVNEKCFIMFGSKKGWRPEDCSLHYAPLCKRPESVTPTPIPPITTPPPPTGNCPKDWIQFGGKCYKYFGAVEEERLMYKQARDACWALGEKHDLVSIHSMEEQAFLTQHLYPLNTSAWIGMHHIDSDEIGHDLVFGWMDNSRTDFTYWAKGHPPPGTWKYCGCLSYEGIAKGQWIADYCEINKNGYICQRPTDSDLPIVPPKPSKCGDGFSGYRNSCYKYVSTPENQKKAEETCQNLGGHLVSLVDSFEQSFLFNFIEQKSSLVWNGLKTVEGTRYLRWTDKQPFYYSNWESERSQLALEKDSCVTMNAANDLKWNVTECSARLPFVCEVTDDAIPDFPETLGTCPSSESSWVDIGDEYCYHVAESSNHILSWDTTSRYCLTKGMKMIKANSDHQLKSLIAYLWRESYNVHLSLIRTFDKKSFIWTDGSSLDYTNWDTREPSSFSQGNDCVAFDQSTGKWKTINCSSGGVAMCQIPKIKNGV